MKQKLNMGCGKDIKTSSEEAKWVNLDWHKLSGVDVVHDLEKYPYPFKDGTFDEVYVDNVLEHLDDIPQVMKELHRICKSGAIIKVIVPYYNIKGAYNDVTHKHYFSSSAFEPFYMKEHKSEYGINNFELVELKLLPTRLGMFIFPQKLRILVSTVFGEIIKQINLTLRVVK